MAEVRYGWNPGAQRYVDLTTGRFLSEEFVLSTVEGRIAEGFDRLDSMLTAVLDGGAPLDAFEQAFFIELRRAAAEATALGYGGWNQVPPEGWAATSEYLQRESQYLMGFMRDIESGRLSEGQIRTRMQMYNDHLRSRYWESNRASHRSGEFTEERRNLNPAEHCDDCLAAAGHWEPIGTLPEIGDSQCRTNCQCTFEYR